MGIPERSNKLAVVHGSETVRPVTECRLGFVPERTTIEHMHEDHGGPHIHMSQELRDCDDACPISRMCIPWSGHEVGFGEYSQRTRATEM